LEDEHLGSAAVAKGAQDYLVKGQVDGVLLGRALRYAVERKRADDNARRLREIELRQAESARLERGLLPKPLMSTATTSVTPFYRPGRHRALLGGDFFDVVQTTPTQLHVMIGDVCGHGVDEAPLGVALRVAWRALMLAGVPDEAVLPSLEQVLVSERRTEELFATVRGTGPRCVWPAIRRRWCSAGPRRANATSSRVSCSGSSRDSTAPRRRFSSIRRTGRC
jgi:serine phosphatase RsbU (regulator of sigma subunit)